MKKSLSLKKLFFLFLIFLSITKIQAGDRDLIVLVDDGHEYSRMQRKPQEECSLPITYDMALAIHEKCAPILATWPLFNSYGFLKSKSGIKFSSFFKKEEWELYKINETFFLFVPIQYKNEILKEKWEITNTFTDQTTTKKLLPEELKLGLKLSNLVKIDLSDPSTIIPNKVDINQTVLQDALFKIFVNKEDIKGKTSDESEELQAKYLNNWYIYLGGHGSTIPLPSNLKDILTQIDQLKKEIGFWPPDKPFYPLLPMIFVKPELQELIKEYLKDPTIKNREKINEFIQTKPNPQRLKETTFQEIIEAYKLLQKLGEEKLVEKLFKVVFDLSDYLEKSDALIAGLSIPTFQLFCNFLNEKISTNLLLYSSCFSGGIHLILPFLKAGVPQKLNYTLVCGALLSRETYGVIPTLEQAFHIPIPPKLFSVADNLQLPKTSRFFTFLSTLSFKRFFDSIKKPPTKEESFAQKINYINLFLNLDGKINPARIFNIPQIRHPGSAWALPIPLKGLTQTITKTIVKAKKMEKQPIVITGEKIVLLATNNMDLTVTISGSPVILSLLSSYHPDLPYTGDISFFFDDLSRTFYFKEIRSPLGFLNLSTKILGKMWNEQNPFYFHILLIEKLICKNDISETDSEKMGIQPGEEVTFSNVLLINLGAPNPLETDQTNADLKVYFSINGKTFCGDWNMQNFLKTKPIHPDIPPEPLKRITENWKHTLQSENRIPILTPKDDEAFKEKYNKIFQDLKNAITGFKEEEEEERKQKTIPEVLEEKKAKIEVK